METDYIHKQYPQQFPKGDFWRQIKRTVNGQPVSESDIQRIVDQIEFALQLRTSDHLLDLGCGNGALASRLFQSVGRYAGVDFSEYLLQVASEYFLPDGRVSYQIADIRKIDDYLAANQGCTKVLIYGCVSYLSKSETQQLLVGLREGLPALQRVLIGNVPDRKQAEAFFEARSLSPTELDNPQSAIGIWWERDEMVALGNAAGFDATCLSMPEDFYASGYRFDLLLESNVR